MRLYIPSDNEGEKLGGTSSHLSASRIKKQEERLKDNVLKTKNAVYT